MLRFRSIAQTFTKIKRLAAFIDLKDLYSLIILILSTCSGYFWGSMVERNLSRIPLEIERFEPTFPIQICEPITVVEKVDVQGKEKVPVPQKSPPETAKTGQFVGSKSGSKYHLPTCPGALRILAENKVWFSSKDEALAKGYTPAANCEGL